MTHPLQAKSFRELIGAPPSSASPSDSVLIIIDAQNEYADGHLKTHNVSSTRSAIAELLQKYRKQGGGGGKIPSNVIHVKHVTPDGAPVFTPNTPLAEEFEELTPAKGEVVVNKQHPGSFTDTELDDILKSAGVKKVVLTGYMAHVCVSTTGRQAAERGYDVLMAREAIGDRDIPGVRAQELCDTVLWELGDAFGTVVSKDDIN